SRAKRRSRTRPFPGGVRRRAPFCRSPRRSSRRILMSGNRRRVVERRGRGRRARARVLLGANLAVKEAPLEGAGGAERAVAFGRVPASRVLAVPGVVVDRLHRSFLLGPLPGPVREPFR